MLKKIFVTSIFAVSLGFNALVWAEDSTAVEAVTNTTAESAAPEAPVVKNITSIEVKGNKSISTNVIISKMKSRVGSPYQENVTSDDLKRLYLLGYFSDVKIDTVDFKDGLKIIVSVVERPVIEKISFSGTKRLTMTEEKIKNQLKSKETQYLDYPNLGEDTRTLKKMYEKMGYSQADINYEVDINKETNKVKIKFNVVEGKKVRIKNILVEGNSVFSDRRILKLMKNKRAWFFNAGILKEDVLKEDVERVKAFYQKNGFADVSVESAISADKEKGFLLYVTIKIIEGKKYLVGNVTVLGNKDIRLKDILAALKESTSGKVYSNEAVKADASAIQSVYFDRGYISAQVQDTAAVNSATGRTDIVYNIVENDITYVDKIKIRGNIKTKDVAIRRELRILPGDRFDGAKLRRSKERLQNLGFFEEVSYDTEDSTAPAKKNLIVDVKETKTGSFSFGGGYSTVESLVGFIEVEQKNFDWRNFPYFTGAGQNLKFRATFGSVSSGYDLSFTEPWMFDYPVSFGFDAYKRTHKRESDIGYGYDENVTGGDLRLGKELSEYLRADWSYRIDQIDIKNITDNASNDLKKEYGKNTISSTQFGLTYDSRDNIFDTKKGDVLAGSLECAGGPFGGNKDFLKLNANASHFIPLFKNSTLEFRGRMGMAQAYANSDSVPIYERFFAGGAYSVRGYEERKVGPVDPVSKDPLGGESMLVGNVEYTYPLFNFMKMAAFYDMGNVWEKVGKIGSGGFKSGFGLGLRIKTPIGPIMLDYGIPLNKEAGEDRKKSGRFHFSASHGF